MLSPRQTTRSSLAGEALGHADDLRDPARLDLDLVGQIEVEERIGAPALAHPAVAEQVDHLPRMALAGDDHHLLDAGELEQLQRVEDHRPVAHREQVLVDDARQLTQPGRLAPGRDQSLCPHAADDATAGAARGVRPSSQNESLDDGADPDREDERADPDRAAEQEADDERCELEPGARGADPDAEAARRDEHQGVARPGAERRADVERRADAEAGERDRDQRRSGRRATPPRARRRRRCAVSAITNVPTRIAFRSVPSPILALSRQTSRSTTTRDDEVRRAERDPELLGESLVEHVPGRQAQLGLEEEDDAAGAEEEPGHEPGDTPGEAAVKCRRRAHALNVAARRRLADADRGAVSVVLRRIDANARSPPGTANDVLKKPREVVRLVPPLKPPATAAHAYLDAIRLDARRVDGPDPRGRPCRRSGRPGRSAAGRRAPRASGRPAIVKRPLWKRARLRLVLDEVVDQHVDAGRPVRTEPGLAEQLGLPLLGDAVSARRLVAVLRQPDPLRAERRARPRRSASRAWPS